MGGGGGWGSSAFNPSRGYTHTHRHFSPSEFDYPASFLFLPERQRVSLALAVQA